MAGKFTDNPYYLAYEILLKKLHRLIAEGKGDTDEADLVRDEMDGPERELTRTEDNRLGGLAADLYMLIDDEIYEPGDASDRDPESLRSDIQEAWDRGDAEATLALLRRGPAFPRDETAHLRARAYAQLGHVDTALLFAEYAARL